MSSPLHDIKAEPDREDPLLIKIEPQPNGVDGEYPRPNNEEELWMPMYHYECTPDIKVEPTSLELTLHDVVKCRWCTFAASREEVDCHASVHDKSCGQCPFTTKHETALWRHRKRFHTVDSDGNPVVPDKPVYIKRFQCPRCPYITAHRHALRSHAARHSANKDYKCDTCQYSTKYASALRRHSLIQHGGAAPMRCGRCQFVTADMATLQTHLHTHDRRSYQCLLCDYSTAEVALVFQHVHVGHGLVDWREIFDAVTQSEVDGSGETGDVPAAPPAAASPASPPASPRASPRASPPAPPKRYSCATCDYTTRDKRALQTHVSKHRAGASFSCDSCHFDAVTEHRLRCHMKTAHDQAVLVYRCQQCPYKTPYKANLSNHNVQKHTKVKCYKCSECSFESAYRHAYVRHRKKHCGTDTTYQCDRCTFYTKFEGKLSWHLLKIHKVSLDQPFKCDYCDFACSTKHRLKTHLTKSLVEQELRCMFCSYTTRYRCQLRCHKFKHTESCEVVNLEADYDKYVTQISPTVVNSVAQVTMDQKQYENQIEDGVLFRKSLLKSDTAVRETDDRDRPFSCQRCEYASRFKGSVLRHYQRQHINKAKPFKCPHCDFATSTNDSMALHKKRSRVDSALYCSCGYSTTFKCQLSMHKKSHNPYRCTKCTYSCKSRFVLETHMMEHSGVGLKCSFCDFVTAKKAILVYHMTSHTGERRYKCQFCSYSAMRTFLLDNHVRRAHMEAVTSQVETGSQMEEDS